MMDWGVIVAAGSLELVILTSAIGVVWKLSRVEVALRAEFTERHSALLADFTEKHAALSAKTYQVEIWSRDEFVRKGSFETVVARLEKTMELMGTKIETAVDRMATKFDSLQQQQQQHRDNRD